MNNEDEALMVLRKARQLLTQRAIAGILDVNTRTVGRWDRGEIQPPAMIIPALTNVLNRQTLPRRGHDFTFIDLFAGIGGMRLGFEDIGGKCVFTSEWDGYCQKTYRENFPDEHEIAGDITRIEARGIPDHDVLLAGFPCQPFSIAGVSKKNALGRPHGFECTTQGTLFFDVARIIAEKRPRAFLLENVKNLLGHDKGNTFAVIRDILRKELGYHIHWQVIDARHFVPQHRERILIAGFREATGFDWNGLRLPDPAKAPRLRAILHPEDGSEPADGRYTSGPMARVYGKYVLTTKLWKYLRDYAEKHRAKGNGFGFGLVGPDDVARTLSARYYKDGSEILVSRGPRRNPRRLTPRECARLMGYPDSFRIPVSDTRAYMQFGNSVAVPVIREVARLVKPHIMDLRQGDIAGVVQRDLFAA
ncbi:MAG: DNA (cytosine-5-)-methyltransferase [Acidiferrobacteraceae bacterium]